MTENSPEPPMAGRTSSVGIFNTGNPLDGLKFVTGMLEDGVAEEVLQLAPRHSKTEQNRTDKSSKTGKTYKNRQSPLCRTSS